jgi:ectoine hydroxylase-related dioxygenase (phytanoyl-CoA dioxygenase family)
VLKADDLEFLRATMDDIYAAYDPERDGLRLPEGYNFSANTVDKHPFFHTLFLRSPVYDIMRHFLGADCILSSLNSLEPLKDQGNQSLHRDTGTPPGEQVYSLNSLWVVDGMDPENGATRVLPGSHLTDSPAPEDEKDVIHVEVPPGTVVVINASLLHGASTNHSGRRRRVLHGYFVRKGAQQQTDQRKYLSPETKAILPPATRRVLALDD